MSLLRSLIAFQDWLSTKMALLTELPATAHTCEDASPVRGDILRFNHWFDFKKKTGLASGLFRLSDYGLNR